jgi:hypothetical protein
MFKMKVTFKNAPGVESVYISESSDFNEIVTVNSVSGKWGKPERWQLYKDEPMAEAYDDADVLEEEIRPNLDGSEQKWVKLKAEYTVEIEDITAQVAQEAINAEALAYLASTDWLVIREVDAGTPCPADIKAERAAARARIVR